MIPILRRNAPDGGPRNGDGSGGRKRGGKISSGRASLKARGGSAPIGYSVELEFCVLRVCVHSILEQAFLDSRLSYDKRTAC